MDRVQGSKRVLKLCLWNFPGGPVTKAPHSSAGGLGSIPVRGTRSHMPQLKDPAHGGKDPCAAIKTWCSQINK